MSRRSKKPVTPASKPLPNPWHKKPVTPPSKPLPDPWQGKAAVRIRHPTQPGLYYDPTGAEPWVSDRNKYATWTVDEWLKIYGQVYGRDGRNWDFFGEVIEIWENE